MTDLGAGTPPTLNATKAEFASWIASAPRKIRSALYIGGALLLMIIGALTLRILTPAPIALTIESLEDKTRIMSSCVERYRALFGEAIDQNASNSYGLCYGILYSSLSAEEPEDRNAAIVFQKSENIVLMWMVVVITVSGVVLAGLQLLASYELAKTGKSSLAGDNSVKISKENIVVQSSVIGVIILATSFAFFMVFVLDVYKITDLRNPSQTDAQAPRGDREHKAAAGSPPPAPPSPSTVPKSGP